ncbi:MAG: Hsp20/alpha crystallin family protein [Gammaproteobacteria bacterium]
MNLSYYEPWSLLNQMQRALRVPAYQALAGTTPDEPGEVVTSDWMPAVDIKEEQDRFVLIADIPGVQPDDIDITMENGILALKGERSHETEEGRADYRRMERLRGTFYRSFSMPDTADADQIHAKFKNGVLEVVIPKQEKLRPRKIEVQQQ